MEGEAVSILASMKKLRSLKKSVAPEEYKMQMRALWKAAERLPGRRAGSG